MNMIFNTENTQKGVKIPGAAMKIAGFNAESVEFHAMKDVGVILKKQMTAMELIHAVESLRDLAATLTAHLANVCGQCDHCFGESEDGCPMLEAADLSLPGGLLGAAGIPADAKLECEVDEENHTVTVFQADYAHSLKDVPKFLRDTFTACGVCMGELDDLLVLEEKVYG